MEENNYETIENFAEYDAYLRKSYFGHVQKEVRQ